MDCCLRAGVVDAKAKGSLAVQRLQAERALLASLADDPGTLPPLTTCLYSSFMKLL